MPLTISIAVSAVLAVLLVERLLANRRMSRDVRMQQEMNFELLKRVPDSGEGGSGQAGPLTPEQIAEAIRKEGYIPEIDTDLVRFKIQGENYFVQTDRLPLLFLIKGYNLDPADWDVDMLREAAHLMSDDLAMVKATVGDDGTTLSYFVAARDRNYESFRQNLSSYLGILEEGQRKLDEEYHRMEDEKEEADRADQPILPPLRSESKVLS